MCLKNRHIKKKERYNREFEKNTIEEQETQINLGYAEKTVRVYTSRKSIYERITRQIGEATKIYYIHGKISGAEWIIQFADKEKLRKVLSRPILIGKME